MVWIRGTLVAALLLMTACRGATAAPVLGLGDSCEPTTGTTADPCSVGECYVGPPLAGARTSTCQELCVSDADCRSGAHCGVASADVGVCVEVDCATMPRSLGHAGGWVCIDGVATECALTGCGCACAPGTFCADGSMCVPQLTAGAPCLDDGDCASGDCLRSGVCSVAEGAPCTADTCERCYGEGPRSFCGFRCSPDRDPRESRCPTGFACVDLIGNYSGDYDAMVCRPRCRVDADCPDPDWSCHEIFFSDIRESVNLCYDDGE